MKSLIGQFEDLFLNSDRKIRTVVVNPATLALIKLELAEEIRFGFYRGAYLSASNEVPLNNIYILLDKKSRKH